MVVASVYIDDDDDRPVSVRIEHTFRTLFGSMESLLDGEARSQFVEDLEFLQDFKVDNLPSWLKNIDHTDKRDFLRRLVGAATYDRLERAARQDLSIIGVALRRAVRSLMPYSVALDDLARALPPEELAKLESFDTTGGRMLSLILELEAKLGGVLADAFPVDLLTLRSTESAPLEVEDVLRFADGLRKVSSDQARRVVEDLNAAFARKIRGARTAIEVSEDAVSQAADSLIELLDRMQKLAFSDDEVLQWAAASFPGRQGLVRKAKNGETVPTARGRALCFLHLGQPTEEKNALNEFLAVSMIEVRRRLQTLKHQDAGTPEELLEVQNFLSAVEGFLNLTVKVVWAAAPIDRLEVVRGRVGGSTSLAESRG